MRGTPMRDKKSRESPSAKKCGSGWYHNHLVTLLKPRRRGHDPADLVHDASDFMAHRNRRRDVAKVPVHELHVGAADA